MRPFEWGLLLGCAVTLIVSAIAAVYTYRRFLTLQKRAQNAERLAELGTLTGGLAHEIKNPLSTVQLNLQLLAEDLPEHDPAFARLTNRLKIVNREAARLKDILDDFLRYAGRIEIDPKPTDLNIVLQELVDFFLPQAQLQRVQLRFKPAPTPLLAQVDSRLLKQALLNLMINALQAMSDRGGELILALSRTPKDAIIDVIDTGPGIPPDAQQKIFDAYYSTKKGGTGLGLAMTRRIIHEHQGQISLKSEAGKGTDFTIRLPINP